MTKKEIFCKIKENKKEILIGAGALIGVGILGYLGVKASSSVKVDDVINSLPDLSSNDFDLSLDGATVTEAWREGEFVNLILNDFKAEDIGMLGSELLEKIPEVTEDTVLTCIMSTTTA